MNRVKLITAVSLILAFIVYVRWEQPKMPTHFGSTIDPMDHEPTDTFVRSVSINGYWIGSAGQGGGAVAGGIVLPLKWRPGLTIVVKWERCDRFDRKNPVPDSEACHWKEKTVLIHPYSEVGMTHLHILDGEEVLIIPSMLGPGHKDYPGPDLPQKNFHEKKGITR